MKSKTFWRVIFWWTFVCVLAKPIAAQDVIPDLKALRAEYPTPMSKAQLSELMNRVALRHPGWGMLRKDAGNNCPTAYPGIAISCDWMVYGPTRWGYDLLIDQEGRAEVVGRSDGDAIAAGAEIVYPWTSGTTPAPTPAPGPTPAPPPTPVPAIDLGPLLQRMDQLLALEQQALARNEQTFEQLHGQHVALTAQVKEHDERPSWLTRFVTSPAGAAILTSVATWLTTWQVTKE